MFCVSFCFSQAFGIGLSGDKLVGEASRIVVAEACVQVLDIEFTEGKVYEVNSVEVNFLIDFVLYS